MTIVFIMLWILVGIGVVLYGIQKKKQYGYISHGTIGTLIIVLVSIVIWPLTILNIVHFVKRQEQVIKQVIRENPKYTRDIIVKGVKIWRDMRKTK